MTYIFYLLLQSSPNPPILPEVELENFCLLVYMSRVNKNMSQNMNKIKDEGIKIKGTIGHKYISSQIITTGKVKQSGVKGVKSPTFCCIAFDEI